MATRQEEMERWAQERTQVRQEAYRLYRALRPILVERGPFMEASDTTPLLLALAYLNRELTYARWCRCPEGAPSYFWASVPLDGGYHGWACLRCRGFRQLG